MMVLQASELERCSSRITYKVHDAVRITNTSYLQEVLTLGRRTGPAWTDHHLFFFPVF